MGPEIGAGQFEIYIFFTRYLIQQYIGRVKDIPVDV